MTGTTLSWLLNNPGMKLSLAKNKPGVVYTTLFRTFLNLAIFIIILVVEKQSFNLGELNPEILSAPCRRRIDQY